MNTGILSPGPIREALEFTFRAIRMTMELGVTKRSHLAVVVTATEVIKSHNPNKSFKENCYIIYPFGEKTEWEHDYESIALSKAEISVRTRKATAELEPHYLLKGDTVYWGSVVLDDIVVACSGVEPYYDEMFSMWIVAAIKAEAKKIFDSNYSNCDFV